MMLDNVTGKGIIFRTDGMTKEKFEKQPWVKRLHMFNVVSHTVPVGTHLIEQFFYSDGKVVRRRVEFRDKFGKVIRVTLDAPKDWPLFTVDQAAHSEEREAAIKQLGSFKSFSEDYKTVDY
jgi:hypothetical protein